MKLRHILTVIIILCSFAVKAQVEEKPVPAPAEVPTEAPAPPATENVPVEKSKKDKKKEAKEAKAAAKAAQKAEETAKKEAEAAAKAGQKAEEAAKKEAEAAAKKEAEEAAKKEAEATKPEKKTEVVEEVKEEEIVEEPKKKKRKKSSKKEESEEQAPVEQAPEEQEKPKQTKPQTSSDDTRKPIIIVPPRLVDPTKMTDKDVILGNAKHDIMLVSMEGKCPTGTTPMGITNKTGDKVIMAKVDIVMTYNDRVSKKPMLVDLLGAGETRFLGCTGCTQRLTNVTCSGFKIVAAKFKE